MRPNSPTSHRMSQTKQPHLTPNVTDQTAPPLTECHRPNSHTSHRVSQTKQPHLSPQQTLAYYFSRQLSAATSCRYICHINLFPSSDRPHVLRSKRGDTLQLSDTIVTLPISLRCCHCELGTTYRSSELAAPELEHRSLHDGRYPSAN